MHTEFAVLELSGHVGLVSGENVRHVVRRVLKIKIKSVLCLIGALNGMNRWLVVMVLGGCVDIAVSDPLSS